MDPLVQELGTQNCSQNYPHLSLKYMYPHLSQNYPTFLCLPEPAWGVWVQGYLAHKKAPPAPLHHWALGIAILQGHRRRGSVLSEVAL